MHDPRPSELVAMQVTLSTPDGHIRGQVEIDSGPMRLEDLVPTAIELTEILVSRSIRKESKAGRHVSCRAGCGACCRQMVCLSIPECFHLVEVLDALPLPMMEQAKNRFAEVESRLESEDLIAPLLDPDYDDDRAMQIANKYFFMGMPCPFLIEESCGIHPYRPVACREYNVTSPAELCSDPYRNTIARIPMPQPLSTPLARITAELTDTNVRLIPLTLAPRWVSENQALRDRTWPGLELFKHFLKMLDELPAS